MTNVLKLVSEFLSQFDIENRLLSDLFLAVDRNSMCQANPSVNPETSYDLVLDLVNQQFTKYSFSWSNKTDDYVTMTWRKK